MHLPKMKKRLIRAIILTLLSLSLVSCGTLSRSLNSLMEIPNAAFRSVTNTANAATL